MAPAVPARVRFPPEDKARSARNAYTGGHWRHEREWLRTLRLALREQRESLPKL